MSVRLEVSHVVDAPIERTWEVLVAWEAQADWIPLTTLRVRSAHRAGLGVRIDALSGFWWGRVPLGLLDRFVVTGWQPPGAVAELEILHLGPYFTGPGVFRLTAQGAATAVHCTELFDLPGGVPAEAAARLALPLMRAGFAASLRSFGRIAAGG